MPSRATGAARLGRLLPDRIRRDLFEPALADLTLERARRRTAPVSTSRRLARGVHDAAATLGLALECLRVAAWERLTGRALPAATTSVPRKDALAMFRLDLRHALRLFRREPGLTAAAVVTLALGIGANTALFAVVEAVLLRPLPYPDAERLVIVRHRDLRTGFAKPDMVVDDFVDLRARQRSFDTLAGYYGAQTTLVGEREPQRLEGVSVTPETLALVGFTPALGRGFEAGDVAEGAAPAVIVSYDVWQTALGGDPQVLSRSVQLGPTRRLIVGVAPRGFQFPPGADTDFLAPMRVPAAASAGRRTGWIYGVGRLRRGTTVAAAGVELSTLSAQLAGEHPALNEGSQYYAVSLRDAVVGDSRRPLLLLLAAVGFVLLIACANVGNLLLARSLARQPEMAMRLALGAGRGRLVAQTLTEGVVLAGAGGFVALAVAWRLAPALAAMLPDAEAIPGVEAVGLRPWVFAFSVAASLLSALLFSAVPSLGVGRDADRAALGGQRRITIGGGARRAAAALVVAEIALAVVLLVGAGLTLRSFAALVRVDPGFSTDQVLTVQAALPAGRYVEQPARTAAFQRLYASISGLAEVEAVGAAAVTPLTGNNWTAPLVRPEAPLAAGERPPEVGWQAATGDYFRALRIPLRAGRLFDGRDGPGAPAVVIVSDALAERYFPGEDPVGRRLVFGEVTAEIVGRVGSIRRASLSDAPRADLYFPFDRANGTAVTLFVRTTGDPTTLVAAMRAAVRRVEPDAVLFEVRTLADIAAASAAVSRLAMRLLGGFAGLALALAAVGIYGVMSYSVRRRTRELGTRLALGASRQDIVALVMREAAAVVALGLAVGLALGVAAAGTLGSILYGVTPWDPVAIAAAVTLLTATAMAAGYLPARRAARVDPATTLGAE